MSAKPPTLNGYEPNLVDACERVLVTLLNGLGPLKDSVCLVGGLTPRYLVAARPPDVPPHAGTMDVDIVIDQTVLADIEAYATLEENLHRMGFQRGTNAQGTRVSWRWEIRLDKRNVMQIEFLTETPEAGGRVVEIRAHGGLSAVNIPYASIVKDLHEERSVTAELIGGDGVATERVRHADLVAFVVLKALALDHRGERKDAHDIVYCLEHSAVGLQAAAASFRAALSGPHREAVAKAIEVLRRRFCDDEHGEGYRKDGPTKAALFEGLDDDGTPDGRDRLVLRQREVNDVVFDLLVRIDAG
jgi:hypothetical protein